MFSVLRAESLDFILQSANRQQSYGKDGNPEDIGLAERQGDDGQCNGDAGMDESARSAGIVLQEVSQEQQNTQSRSDVGVIKSAEKEQRRKQTDVECCMNLLRTEALQRKDGGFIGRPLCFGARRNRGSGVKGEEKDGKKREGVYSPQSIQITSSSDFVEEDRKKI